MYSLLFFLYLIKYNFNKINLEFLLFYFKIIYNNLMNNELIEKNI